MNVFGEAYTSSIAANQHQARFWENYVSNLNDLDFSFFSNQLKIPSLIPIGSRMLFRGDLIHTNEITVALGDNYFAKCSAKQAEIIKQHRIKGAQEKLILLKKELNYLENQLNFTQTNVLEECGQEIIEHYSEEEEAVWRLQHRENVKKYKQEHKYVGESSEISNEDIWSKLEELELKEELENENTDFNTEYPGINKENPKDYVESHMNDHRKQRVQELQKRLLDLTNKENAVKSVEEDIFKRLDQLEEQETLEDELDRLNDDSDSSQDADNTDDSMVKTSKKSLSFTNDEDQSCVNIYFTHSDVIPDYSEYDKTIGILKPSDIYSAFPENFKQKAIISILKKPDPTQADGDILNEMEMSKSDYVHPKHVNVMGEVIENKELSGCENKIVKSSTRPPSKFKAMRMLQPQM